MDAKWTALRLGHFSQALPVEKASTERRGTPQYMAPELLCEVPDQTGHSFLSDLWSLGCLLHELFMGQVPFASASSLQLQRLVLEAPPKMHGATMDFQDRWVSERKEGRATISQDLVRDLLRVKQRLAWPQLRQHRWWRGECLGAENDAAWNKLRPHVAFEARALPEPPLKSCRTA